MSNDGGLALIFWVSLGLIVYPYLIYPLLVGLAARWRPERGQDGSGEAPATFSIVLPVHNEERAIGGRVRELLEWIARSGCEGELIVVSDGSTDRTAERARGAGPARVLEFLANRGKAAAMSAGVAEARGEVIVFADVRQRWGADAVPALLERFRDPRVGAVGGELVLQRPDGALAGVGAYWRFETWLRRQESALGTTVGLTGAIAAVRRSSFLPIPQGVILDDLYWPLRVAMQGLRVVHQSQAVAYDRLPERVADEFRRKVRTLGGNFQLMTLVPGLLMPWRHRIAWFYLSHKASRLVVPWALIGLLISSGLMGQGFAWRVFQAQCVAYLLGLLGLTRGLGSRLPGASLAASFLVLNTAALVGFWVWLRGGLARSWVKAGYGAEGHSPVGSSR